MAGNGKVVIKIDGDDSGYRKVLRGITTATKTAVKGLSVVGGAVAAAWSAVGLTSVKYIASIEQLEASFATMTGSAAKAADIMARLRKLGAETPFETEDLAATTQLLMQYGMDADVAIDRMSMLGDIAQGSADKMNRIATAYGQMTSAGKVQLEDVKQMIEAGFNPLLEISERTGESMDSLYKRISKGKLAVDEITQAMQNATSEGGKFYKSMERQSQTINGMLSTIKDEAQELGGRVFEPFAESLRSTVLPEARNIIADMNKGFQDGGIDGMVNALTRRIPQLTDAGVQGATKMFSAIGKKLPTLMKSLFSQIPTLLKGAVDLAPQLSDALFSVLSNGVEILIGQMPQLIPTLAVGLKDMFLSAAMGVVDLVSGITAGVDKALKDLGLISLTTDEAFDRILADYDREHVEKLKAMIEIDPEIEVSEADFKLNSLYDEIETTLTDGLADTPEIIDGLKKKTTEYYNNQIENINAWRNEALANLDSTLPQAEYDAAVKDINTKADQMVLGLQNASDATIKFIDENAGKATASVQNNLGALETIYQTAVTYRDQIAEMTGEAKSVVRQQQELVAQGLVKDEKTIINALAANAQERTEALEAAEQKKSKAMDRAIEASKTNTEGFVAEQERIEAEWKTEQKAINDKYLADSALLWSGATEALSPDIVANLEKAQTLEKLQGQLESIAKLIVDAFSDPEVMAGEISMQDFVAGAIGDLAFTDEDYLAIAEQMGIDEIDPSKIQEILISKISEAAKWEATGTSSIFGTELTGMITGDLQERINSALGAVDVETGPVADILQAAMEKGILDGIEGIDLTTAEGKLQLILGQFGDMDYSTIGTTANEGVANALSDTGAVESASTAVGDAAVSDIDRSSEAKTAGQNIGQGLVDGLQSKKDAAVAKAREIADAVSAAMRTALKIHSPSRVTREIGEFTGEGFRIGLESSLRNAVRTAENIAGSLNLAPKLTAPDLSNAFASATQGWADAESMRPIYLMLRGKVIGEALAADNARAANNYNRSIALGVGKG